MNFPRSLSRHLFLALALSAAALLAALLLPARGLADSQSTTLASLSSMVQQQLNVYSGQSGPTGGGYTVRNGIWSDNAGPFYYEYNTAATGAAVLGALDGNPADQQLAITTYDAAIDTHQIANGAFVDDSGTPDDVDMGFFMVGFGVSDIALAQQLDAATAQKWQTAYAKAADYILDSGDLTWYINGNVQLRQTEIMWLAYVITGDAKYLDAYNAEWQFTISPGQSRWSGYGLHITTQPTQADGSDGAGYLAESNQSDVPGYDGNYTAAQLDTATDLWVLTHDPRYLRLMNLEYNQLAPHVSNWTLDATNGTRDNFREPFMCAATSVLPTAGRSDLAGLSASQLVRMQTEYTQSDTYPGPNFSKGFETWLVMPLLNQRFPAGMATRPLSQGGGTTVTAPTSGATGTPTAGTITTTAPATPTVTVNPTATTTPGGTISITVADLPRSPATVTAGATTAPVSTRTTTTRKPSKNEPARSKPVVKSTRGRAVAAHKRLTRAVRIHNRRRHVVKIKLHPSARALRRARRAGQRVKVSASVKTGGANHTYRFSLRIKRHHAAPHHGGARA